TPSEPARADPPPVDFNGRSLPPIDIFNPSPKGPASPADLELKGQRIQETLASFNVAARVVGYHCGPVVTQFDVQPERGVKVRRITELQNDLALALAAPTIRIQAPVPGKPVVGIEIPNSSASMVALRDLLESEAYTGSQALLKVALGKDVAGTPRIIDLTRMPHLLIAGATGSGKSACINAIISCLLYQSTPDQVRLMMIDPKMVELAVYNGVPHLLSPVVTQMDKVVGVLQWALREMERRYQLFADTTVRNIQRYNEKMESINAKKLPFIVVIVDELADLMMVAPEDVEDAICRLAQLARAAGIHLVIATQRPSVDVVTGLIKANFPARIAFAMTSQVDSRTILDTVGAEKLLGRGDMLYMPPDAPSTVRLQGAFLSEQEVERLVEFWQRSPLQAAVQRVSEDEFAAAEKAAAETGDELLDEATRVVREYQHASVSLLQRRLKVGYARAARLMDQLEARSVVGPADGSKQRRVLDQDLTGEE
ncbi:MAG: DNA translocase FtsK, partial [Chloroflexi bacterium]|nr:DNA translocase FtsK [Chloroflexota bacterium]